MKPTKALWTVLLLTVCLLCGCTGQTGATVTAVPDPQAEPAQTTSASVATEPETALTQPETVATEPKTALTQPETIPTEATGEEKKEVLECDFEEGFVTQESIAQNTPCQVRLTKHPTNADPAQGFTYALYIEVDTGNAVLMQELESPVIHLKGSSLFLADIDGDKAQEILVHDNTGGCGGFGLWRTWILKVENNEIRVLFHSFNEFDTGFQSRFLEGYQMEVANRFTGYRLVFDVKESHKKYIDSSDTLPDHSILLDPFYVFEPEDTDGDGISEVICKQYTSIYSHADYTGTACSVLRFNPDTQTFDVVKAWYEPNTES